MAMISTVYNLLWGDLFTIPLPGGGEFALGTSGGPLIAGLILGHFGHVGRVNLKIDKRILETMREFGLMLFLLGAGTGAGGLCGSHRPVPAHKKQPALPPDP